eukprot:89387-Amorphochlora_amoeboformis.AAC.1
MCSRTHALTVYVSIPKIYINITHQHFEHMQTYHTSASSNKGGKYGGVAGSNESKVGDDIPPEK